MNALNKLFRKSAQTTKLANIFHDEGTNFLREKRYFDALLSFNKSLCHSQPNSIDMSKAFASRSAVYFELRHYQACLENIQLARRAQSEHGTNICLDELERQCNKLIKYGKTTDTPNLFKLSYPHHQKVPFIVNSLELRENNKFGRFITTNRNLRPGDVIAIEEPFIKFIDLETLRFFKYQRCFNCLKSHKLNLLTGPHSVMSCSQACHNAMVERNIDSEVMIQNELNWKVVKMIQIKNDSMAITGNIETLQNLFYGDSKTIFDFDLNNIHHIESQKNLLKCAISMIGGTTGKVDKNLETFKLMLGSYDKRHRTFFINFVDHLMNVCRKTQFSLNIFDETTQRFEKIGNCLLTFGGLLNHSCDPNLLWIPVDGKFVYIVAKPISAGEQLFLCYRKTFLSESLNNRQKQLMKQYGFVCECPACTQNYPIQEYLVDPMIESPTDYKNYKQIQEEVAKNWRYIEETFSTQSHNNVLEK